MSDDQRIFPKVLVRVPSPNFSSRRGAVLELIAIHATQGANVTGLADLVGLGGWFAKPSTEASSHVATDGEGHSARYVADANKAWHVAAYNPPSLGIEQVGFAEQHGWPRAQYAETARWVAYWSRLYGIPIQEAVVSAGAVVRPGVIRHSQLGVLGGNHDDPGAGYDMHNMLQGARSYRVLQTVAHRQAVKRATR